MTFSKPEAMFESYEKDSNHSNAWTGRFGLVLRHSIRDSVRTSCCLSYLQMGVPRLPLGDLIISNFKRLGFHVGIFRTKFPKIIIQLLERVGKVGQHQRVDATFQKKSSAFVLFSPDMSASSALLLTVY